MIPVAEALERLFSLTALTGVEDVPLDEAAGRVLARPLESRRDQPPFTASAMDGYALIGAEAKVGASFTIVGEAAAGRGWDGRVAPGQTVRIFTGAPVPDGADRVVIQEDTARDGDVITLTDRLEAGTNIRPAGADFRAGARIEAPRRLSAPDIALLAAFNHPVVPVRKRPVVALIATGDELVLPGEDPAPGQIIASNSFGLAAQFRAAGAHVRLLPVARDAVESLKTAFRMAEGADLVVTIGGASVGDHDLVAGVLSELGSEMAFHKVAMRPGKPLMAGRLGDAAMVGLPGNPVSAMVCGAIFIRPMLDAMLGLPAGPVARRTAPLTTPLGPNGPREHYMRARLEGTGIAAFERQDSSLLSILSEANALIVRTPGAGAVESGAEVDYIPL